MLQTDNLTAAQPQRIITAQSISPQEELLERALRPKTLDDYIGQDKAKEQLAIFIQAAKKRGEALDHTLLFGPPGPSSRAARAWGGIRPQSALRTPCQITWRRSVGDLNPISRGFTDNRTPSARAAQ